MKLALELKSERIEVMISSIVFRDDSPELNDKGNATNLILKAECQFYNILFIENSNIRTQHLNGSKLHLNYKRTTVHPRLSVPRLTGLRLSGRLILGKV